MLKKKLLAVDALTQGYLCHWGPSWLGHTLKDRILLGLSCRSLRGSLCGLVPCPWDLVCCRETSGTSRAAGSSFIRFGQWPVSCIIPSRTALASNEGEKKTEWEELSGEKDGVNE